MPSIPTMRHIAAGRTLSLGPGMSGELTMVHDAPPHCSIRVWPHAGW